MPKLPRNMIRRKDRPGYWFRKSEGGRTRQIALGTNYQDACTRLRQLQKEDTPVVSMTVGEAAKRWVEGYAKTARTTKGATLAKRRVELYLKPFFGFHLVGKLTGEHLRAYRLWLEGRGISVQTVKHILSDVRCFLNWCEATGLIGRSPFPKKVMPRIQERPPDRVGPDVAKITALPGHFGFVARLAVGTGLRWGELCRLTAADVDGDVLVVHQTKTGKVRRVPLSPELQAELRTRIGKLVPYSETSCGAYAALVKKLTGLERFHVHQLRHEFACSWLERGGSLAGLQQILGHSTVVTTQRYARLGEEALREEAKRVMGGRVSPPASPAQNHEDEEVVAS